MNITISFFICLYLLSILSFKVYLSFYSYIEYFVYLLQPYETKIVYDYIIVGCGTAGSLIAHRLSSVQGISILVLEAGGSGGPLLNPPAVGPLLQGTIHDWQYETTQQENACQAMHGKKCKLPTGKIVGGSARLNNMIHLRGYLNEIVPWFNGKYNISHLNDHISDLEKYDLPFEDLKYKTELSSSLLNAAKELDYEISDLNGIGNTGFMETVVNQKNGGRWSTSHTLLSSHLKNGNLLPNSFVQKILIDKNTKTATGVVYERYGKIFTVSAEKGVILTSGAIGTPKLLLLSGIGPDSHLDSMDISTIQDLPVGFNLKDHVATGLDLVLLNNSLDFDLKNFFSPTNSWNYLVNGDGPWTSAACEVLAVLKTPLVRETNNSYPDLQLMVLPVGISTDHGAHLRSAISITDKVWDKYFDQVSLNNSISILPIVLHPKSAGSVRLQSNDPYDSPLIDPKYLSDHRDLDVILAGIDLIKKLIKTKSMQDLGAKLNSIPFPGCEDLKFDSREYWVCYIKHLTLTVYHPAGTCKMGDEKDPNSVVNHNFQVIGVKNLYIADASIFPTMPSGNINTAVALAASIFSKEILSK